VARANYSVAPLCPGWASGLTNRSQEITQAVYRLLLFADDSKQKQVWLTVDRRSSSWLAFNLRLSSSRIIKSWDISSWCWLSSASSAWSRSAFSILGEEESFTSRARPHRLCSVRQVTGKVTDARRKWNRFARNRNGRSYCVPEPGFERARKKNLSTATARDISSQV